MTVLSYTILPLEERGAWDERIKTIPHSFYHTAGYSDAVRRTTGYRTFLFAVRGAETDVVCPFVERDYGRYRDVATPSGLAGFTGRGDWAAVEHTWSDFVRDQG